MKKWTSLPKLRTIKSSKAFNNAAKKTNVKNKDCETFFVME